MFHALTHHPDLTQAQHRALPQVSNTDLTNLKAELLGQPASPTPWPWPTAPTSTPPCWSPHTMPAPTSAASSGPTWKRWPARCAANATAATCCTGASAEQSYTATHTATGVGVKLRPDLLVRSPAGRQLTLIDFKTTSSPDLRPLPDHHREVRLRPPGRPLPGRARRHALPHHRRAEEGPARSVARSS